MRTRDFLYFPFCASNFCDRTCPFPLLTLGVTEPAEARRVVATHRRGLEGHIVQTKVPEFFAFTVALSVAVAACGGGSSSPGSSGSTPTAPSTPVQANRAPVINSMNFAPAFGIAQLTQFSFNASASDPDGDPITYTWDVAGNPFSGTNDRIVFSGGGNGTARVTVSDSKGATATDTRDFWWLAA